MSKPNIGPSTYEEALRRIYAEKLAIMQKRQRKYGSGNITGTGLVGCATRIRDKWERFWRFALAIDTTDYDDEGIEDTLIDMSNHADISLMLKRGWWGLPMEKKPPDHQRPCPCGSPSCEQGLGRYMDWRERDLR